MKNFRKKIRSAFTYQMGKKDLFIGMVEGTGILMLTAWLFFDSLFAVIFLLPYMVIHLKKREKTIKEKETERISMQFKDGMMAISASLGAGYSVENAFREAIKELENLYGTKAFMAEELRKIVRKIDLNENVEDALEKMAEEIELEDAIYFAQVFRFAKRSGGNLMEIIGKTAGIISDKLGVQEDIRVLISGKKMEQKIMNCMPFGIIAYMRMGAYEFISPMYGNPAGVCAMIICLGLYLAALTLSDKIVQIKV